MAAQSFYFSAPLSEQISFYFYAVFAEKGQNGEVVVEDAWFSFADLFGSRVGMQPGQLQISDVMFSREVRMTFKDFMLCRKAGITYEHGVLFGRDVGPLQVDFGIVNGIGINANANINSPGVSACRQVVRQRYIKNSVCPDWHRCAGHIRRALRPVGRTTERYWPRRHIDW